MVLTVALIVALAIVRPRGALLRESLRSAPDVLQLLPRLAAGAACRVAYGYSLRYCWPQPFHRRYPTSFR